MSINCTCYENYKHNSNNNNNNTCYYSCLNFSDTIGKHIYTYTVLLWEHLVLQTFDSKDKSNNKLTHFCFMKKISSKSTQNIQLP